LNGGRLFWRLLFVEPEPRRAGHANISEQPAMFPKILYCVGGNPVVYTLVIRQPARFFYQRRTIRAAD